MSKYYGMVGYASFEETSPGVETPKYIERPYFGEILQNYRRLESNNQVNDSITLTMRLSIISDPYAMENFHQIRYVTYMGAKWKVNTVEVTYPTLTLNMGGVFNEASEASQSSM